MSILNEDIYKFIMMFQSKGVIASEEIETVLNINQGYLKKIISFINSNNLGAKVHVLKGRGYHVEIIDRVLLRSSLLELVKNTNIDIDLESKLISELLSTDDYLNANQLTKDLYVSRTKLTSTIEDLNTELKTYDISIEYEPYKGFILKGDEIYIRNYMLNKYSTKVYINENDQLVSFLKIHNIDIPTDRELRHFKTCIEVVKRRINKLEDFQLEQPLDIITKLSAFLQLDLNNSELCYLSASFKFYISGELTTKEQNKISNYTEKILLDLCTFYEPTFIKSLKDYIYETISTLYLENKYNYLFVKSLKVEKNTIFDDLFLKFYVNNLDYLKLNLVTNLSFLSRLVNVKHDEYKKKNNFNKIALIKSNTLHKDEFHISTLKESLGNEITVKIFSEHSTNQIINFNPNLIITSHIIDDYILKELQHYRRINIERIYFELTTKELRNYILNYDYIQILNKELSFEPINMSDEYIINSRLQYTIYLIEEPQSIFKIDLENKKFLVSKKFLTKSMNHLLLLDRLLDLIEKNSLITTNEKNFLVIMNSLLKN